MTNEEILKKAIKKANWNGAKLFGNLLFKKEDFKLTLQHHHIEILLNDYTKITDSLYGVIFSHSFAKAFWGEKKVCNNCGNPKCKMGEKYWEKHAGENIAWQYHLQQMVLEEEPLKYLERFLCKN